MNRMAIALAGLMVLLPASQAQPPPSPLESYRKLAFPPKDENFDKGWQDRVIAEYDVINNAELGALHKALKDPDPFVRAIAARTLGIRADKSAADVLAALVKSDPEYFVRIRAVESLAYLKLKPEVIELAKKDKNLGVQFTAEFVAGQLTSDIDYAAQVRTAYAVGIKREVMGTAKVGQPAPDFSAQTTDGAPFKLSSVFGKKPIAIYFAAFDG